MMGDAREAASTGLAQSLARTPLRGGVFACIFHANFESRVDPALNVVGTFGGAGTAT
jgi:hypothetical protein